MRVLLDHNIPLQIGRLLPHDVIPARYMGWGELVNGRLLAQAEEAGFECLLTADQNLPYQNNLRGRRMAVVVLNTNKLNVIASQTEAVIEALGRARAGAFIEVTLTLPPLRRRPFSRPEQ